MQDFTSKEFRSMPSSVAGVVFPMLGVLLGVLLHPASSLADSFFARACVSDTFDSVGNTCQQDEALRMAIASATKTNGAISLQSGTGASAGWLAGTSRAVMSNMTDWSSGYINAGTDARLEEAVDPNWEDWAARGYDSMNDIDHYALDFQLEASGSQSATSSGWGVSANSTVSYSYSVGWTSGSGSKSTFAGENYGTWGLIDASFLIGKDATYELSMTAHTFATGSKTYLPGGVASIDASADFSHTLRWMGITGIHAFDASGNEIPLPADARLQLIGRDSGFDYWNAAVVPSIPEPSTTLLIGAGLTGIAGFTRRNPARRPAGARARRR